MKRYPGWNIVRYDDGSMQMIPPVRKESKAAPARRILKV